MNPLFTIGHSNLEIEPFLSVLAQHCVETLCDVRSRPASFRFPQFNREQLEAALASAGIRYEFFGESLGGRPADPRVYREDGLRSEEHTSELQSPCNLVCRLLLEKNKRNTQR